MKEWKTTNGQTGTKKGLRSSWKRLKRRSRKEEDLEGSSSLLVEEETRPTTDCGGEVIELLEVLEDDRVTVQNVQVRWSKGYGVNTGKGKATGTWVINTVGDIQANQPRVIRFYNYKGKGHITKQCTAKKRVKDSEWFKEKMLLAQAQEAGLHTTSNFKADHVDAFDSYCDDEATASAIFMASLSHAGSINGDTVGPTYDSDILSKVPYYNTYHETDVLNPVVLETKYSEHLVSNNDSYDELTSDRNVISYADYMVINAMILYVIEQMQSQVEQCNTINLENRRVNESLTSELERYKEKVKALEERQKSKHFFTKQEENLDSQICQNLEIKLLNQQESNNSFNELSKQFEKLEEYCISLELSLQHNKETMICDESRKIHDASLITEINNKSFEINDLKAHLQEKSILVNELKQFLDKLKGKSQVTLCEKPDIDSRIQKLDDENVSLAFKVSSFEREREHLKIESEPINMYFKNNKAAHHDYLKVTKEHVATLQELLEQAIALKPLDANLDYACKFAQRIKDLLVYAKTIKQMEKNEWKPTGRIFTTIGHRWIPTGRTFHLVGNQCPLTRITLAIVVSPGQILTTTVIPSVESSKPSKQRYDNARNSLTYPILIAKVTQ
ncbi:hypothetical protein Tco_1111774 [Tanacetum coccineum]|uniref:Uncharacterized protein n=1 Tax=Tanacetum coccineum TaxID=301880 RepID=A0ABQ5IMJ7_9ASTR